MTGSISTWIDGPLGTKSASPTGAKIGSSTETGGPIGKSDIQLPGEGKTTTGLISMLCPPREVRQEVRNEERGNQGSDSQSFIPSTEFSGSPYPTWQSELRVNK